ncbi:NAD(P)-binding protein [Reyranella sp.]|uniref:NAD(P)-binding protein n=1 Tax=Reyranella sp. TaxID=1929291 RepID=UPI004035EBA3
MITGGRLGARAVIVGAGIAGLAAAAALASFFETVEVWDKDELPRGPRPRKGIPQDLQVHILLKGGELGLERLIPGTRAALLQAGATEVRQSRDVSIWERDSWQATRDLGYSQLMMSRPALEFMLRQQVLKLGNVAIRDRSPVEVLPSDADLTVIATGRGDRLLAGIEVPETMLGLEVNYSSARFAKPACFRGEGRFIACIPKPPDDRYGLVCPVENDEWLITLSSRFDNRVPDDLEGFRAYAAALPVPDIAERLREAVPLTPVHRYRIAEARWRHYDRAAGLPPRVLPIGDCISNFNPTFGQGMSVAAGHAVALRDVLAETSDLDAIAAVYLPRAAEVSRQAWSLAAMADLEYPRTVGERPARFEQMVQGSEAMRRAAVMHPEVHLLRFEIGNLLKPDSAVRSGPAARLVVREMARAGR